MSENKNENKYDRAQHATKTLGLEFGAAELQGNICGHAISSYKDAEQWLIEVLGQRDHNDLSAKEAVITLTEVLSDTIKSLNSESFELKILLPDELAPFQQRLEALSQWCDSFLYALGLANIDIEDNEEVSELVRDISEIARIDYNDETLDKDNELDLLEITEYVKVGVIIIYDTYKPVEPQPIEIPEDDDDEYLS